MNAGNTIKSAAVGLALGILAAVSADGSNALTKVSHATDTPYKSTATNATKAQPQKKGSEVQVAVMATFSTKAAQPAPTRKQGVFIHR
jgi:hypothetical protein